QGRLADVGQTDDAAFDTHCLLHDSRFRLAYSIGNYPKKTASRNHGRAVCNRFMASLKSPATASGITSMAASMAWSISTASCGEGRLSTQPTTRSLWPGWPIP